MVKFHHQPSAPKYAGAKPGDRANSVTRATQVRGMPDGHRLPHLDFITLLLNPSVGTASAPRQLHGLMLVLLVTLLMDKILHDPKDPKLWELWYIPYYG